MGGFLTNLKKKGDKGGSMAADLLLQGAASVSSTNIEQPGSEGTEIVSQPEEDLGSADALLAELEAESKALRGGDKSGAPVRKTTVQATPPSSASAQPRRKSSRGIKVVQSRRSGSNRKPAGKMDIFDESLPWWLTDPVKPSPQVDLLVPASRFTLNELLSDGVSNKDLPSVIQRAVSIAAKRLAKEVRFSEQDVLESIQELTSLMTGKGPLQALYDDPAVTDIYMDGHDSIKCVRRGQAVETPFRFRSPEEYEAYVTQMLQSVDRVLNMSIPIVDCVLNDQWRSRINAVHASLRDGGESSLVIRVPRLQQISFYDLLQTRTLPAAVAAWLAELVSSGEANVMVMGPTGSGKTTLTTALLSAVGSDERICTIEDVPEIFVPTAHLEKLVCRPENSQGEGAIGMPQLLRAALRRAPHRVIVGEIRDAEGPLFLKALETGHAGSVATIHAENPKDGLWRLLDVVAAYEDAPQESIQRRIARALDVLISVRKVNGRPALIGISEVLPPVNGEFVVKDIVKFETEENGKRKWRIQTTHSKWLDELSARGMELAPGPSLLPVEKNPDKSTY